ncbi:uncharacterized protein LOC102804923 [Saccoglossus kowalevskii]|uniref:Uncharacterized protein LOC102804923 n=1 Tax=Saccoglossus kowalevskii TaxID=10224 RepID=A0ABM0MZV1_SACKO|nr:PREDICTED: uncharacterized protein LOC102804923 [Saccoglossus kowalevskii]
MNSVYRRRRNRGTLLKGKHIQWSQKTLTLEDFLEDYEMPQLIKVVLGWCGVDESSPDSLQSDQLVIFHRFLEQVRVVAEDQFGQHLSITRDYAYKFKVLADQRGKKDIDKFFTIREILERFNFPIRVQLARTKSGAVVNAMTLTEYRELKDFGVVTLLKTHTIGYLIGHCVPEFDLMECGALAVLPLPLEVDLVVGTMPIDGKNDKWYTFLRNFSKEMDESVDFDMFINKFNDVYLLQPGEIPPDESLYDVIKPTTCSEYADYRAIQQSSGKGSGSGMSTDSKALDITPEAPEVSAKTNAFLKELLGTLTNPEDDLPVGPPPPLLPRSPIDRNPPEIGKRPPKPPKRPGKSIPENVSQNKPLTVKSHFQYPSPAKLQSLNVQEVCRCLEALNLDHYSDHFKSNDIDGEMMCALTHSMLVNDIKMRDLDAMKLKKFIEGWRPNLG